MNCYTDVLLKDNKTAFYVFDIEKLKNRIAYLKNSLPESVSLCYAVKANTFIIKEIIDDVDRFEICSPGEEEICYKLGVPSEKMVISGVYKTPAVIEGLVANTNFAGICTVESLQQYELLCELSVKYNRNISVLLRVTNDSQFGINEADIEAILSNRASHSHIDIHGIQYFSGTQKTSLKKFKREIERLDAFLCRLRDEFSFEAKVLEYGPGFPAAYFQSDEIDEHELLDGFSQLIDSMEYKTKITLELGRSIAASCGSYFTHIVDIKHNKGQSYILIDGGMHHIVYFGQHMAMKLPYLSVCGKESMPVLENWTICGSLCSMNDIVAKQVPLPDICVGDVIRFENTGAYCMTEGISLFLSRDIPAVYLTKANGEIIRVRKSYETMALNTPEYERMN